MQLILGKHRQDFDEIRRLCLICHGLDYTTSSFSDDEKGLRLSNSLSSAVESLISSNLLSLAIALRVNIYQKVIKFPNYELGKSSSLYYDNELVERAATLKQVIDKIIHADEVLKPIVPDSLRNNPLKIAIQFKGTEFGRKKWTMNVILEKFAEEILLLLDEHEAIS
ncbi:hypothetical protein NQT74_15725 [Alteromonas stellipolaris]|uniref:hypothetical protein n=1 Tax=Alteromonas stellipolaris TaxID=233316 RepID=UPI0021195FFC|nr:hypothetical protein [Alteromonas stellipolaris]MCQ8850038.1 hypothetical protein [Alteromonas stellipolaris]